MKKLIYILGVLAIQLTALVAGVNKLSAQTKWDYPVKPGTEEWKAFKTHDEMLKAIQIPDEILYAVTTRELVELCLNYPLSIDFYAYNSLQQGLRLNVAKNFNGVQELFRRQDNVQCLLDVLKNDDLLKMQSLEHISKTSQIGESIIRNSLAETLLSHELVLANADAKQQKEIAAVAVRNMLIKESRPDLYSHHGLGASAYLLGTTLKMGNSKAALSSELELFLKGSRPRDITRLIEELMNHYTRF